MNKPTRLILACFLACFSFVITYAQSPTPLQPGTPIEREVDPGQVHTFTIDLEENSLIQLVVEQKGIDVVVTISSPAGKFSKNTTLQMAPMALKTSLSWPWPPELIPSPSNRSTHGQPRKAVTRSKSRIA